MKPRIVYRPLHGILLLDKPAGLSSNNALQAARRLLRADKGGHTGSLDPLATGLLPLCFGEATKIAGLLLGSAKAYDAEIVLGVTTDTDDADGEPLRERAVPDIGDAALQAALAPFIGRIQQQAPIYSALKQGGEPLYAKARRGERIEAPVREVHVQAIDVLGYSAPGLRLRVTCGSGTYIRSLARDLGEVLGCGAHIASLRRLWVEPFRAPQMITLEALSAALEAGAEARTLLLPIEAGLADFARIVLDQAHAARFRMGQRLRDAAFPPGQVAVFGPDGTPSGLGLVDADGRLSPQRLFNGLNEITAC
ncbi:tRNA pseudouridine(55) synthase TruB [Xanthomonas euvesicatoria pv. eucalypti]|uniref:tRNA pseudouridine(55) synthase TruB n=1 Tax=Xanthomonas euvesicatoria TaxID=456327 RepID=UPI0026E372E2|nr:tRNA pseudouridine(55) synthase TruB [Xanthomonas euvesicatoria]MDO7932479.1 tRNA pseudouridine(55) synthase TruB [Xanthomonas euvesicatoria pv. eucalypti]MDO7937171.1 tRNA pseudouridine(55) synthase TruB [Xanthomonas euvesicatoria pv. eucalypti]MDO7941184.1 tRNA pseudouridine(55) synthase TruB [Xanthomonas euvesicatoria pv. eucalypti]MDO7943422.1 tRNA pseudouridine(55) synthase TruB [Xanthomonas euvesicatoria pv. eucalypti]MDO7948832.1 tRNA pseudouridine(55) synthase TruB [Xanthomonas euve